MPFIFFPPLFDCCRLMKTLCRAILCSAVASKGQLHLRQYLSLMYSLNENRPLSNALQHKKDIYLAKVTGIIWEIRGLNSGAKESRESAWEPQLATDEWRK